jgi:hypothetical protein
LFETLFLTSRKINKNPKPKMRDYKIKNNNKNIYLIKHHHITKRNTINNDKDTKISPKKDNVKKIKLISY